MITAKLRHRGAVSEDIDYIARRSLDKALFQQMLTGRWIKDKRNLMLTGPCSVGKTWLACALAQSRLQARHHCDLQTHTAPL
jgi:DNA replication protein DnaC